MQPISKPVFAGLALAFVALITRWLPAAEPAAAAGTTPAAGLLSTLFADDPLECTLDLTTATAGMIVQDGEVRNRNSHLCMGYFPDSLTVAIQGGDRGAIVDLGSLEQLASAVGVQPVGNGGNAYVALDTAFARAHAGLQELEGTAHATIRQGHVYLLRVAQEREPDLLAKLIVLEFQPGASVTFRWQLLD